VLCYASQVMKDPKNFLYSSKYCNDLVLWLGNVVSFGAMFCACSSAFDVDFT
jgi:hypothetical protein